MKKYRKGFLCGFFDILHDGHIDILRKAKAQCDYLIVGVGTDDFMLVRKNRLPILNFEQRVEVVRSIKYVDEVVEEVDLDKVKAYYDYGFDVMFAGDDHISEEIYTQAEKTLKELGVDTVYIKREKNVSSTQIRKRVIEIASGGAISN